MIDTRYFTQSLQGKPIAVFGLGLSGLSSAKALIAVGGKVFAWDDNEKNKEAALQEGVPLFDFVNAGLKGYGALLLSPGVPLFFPSPHPAILKAQEAGIEIIGDIEILHRSECQVKTIGITGTNGKSTTTALVTHILKESGLNAVMGGNIGKPVLELDLLPDKSILVLEISSYQMDLCPTFRPDISVLLNITPDHLDRHGTMDIYAASKGRIFEGPGVAVCGIDDSYSKAIFEKISKIKERDIIIPISVHTDIGIGDVSDIPTLKGIHNRQNIYAAYAVCTQFGISREIFLRHIKTYPGLPHRQFLVRVLNGVSYINDSKATNAEAAAKAIACYDDIYLIAGGQSKEGGLHEIEPLLRKIRHVFLIGEAMEEFSIWLSERNVPHTKNVVLESAVLDAHKMAQKNKGTVVLSPACASWDQFRNFGHRGDVFTKLVQSLPEEGAS